MIDGWNSRYALLDLLNGVRHAYRAVIRVHETTTTFESIFFLRQGNPRPHSQDVRLRSRFVLVVKPHRAIGAKIIRVPGFGRMAALDPIHSTSRDHFTFSIYNQINFFRGLV